MQKVEITNKSKIIEFNIGDNHYKLDLIKTRAKKHNIYKDFLYKMYKKSFLFYLLSKITKKRAVSAYFLCKT